jgi:hypothetical protein
MVHGKSVLKFFIVITYYKGGEMKKSLLLFSFITFILIGCSGGIQDTPQSTIESFVTNVKKLNATSPTTRKEAEKVLKKLFATEKAYGAFTSTFRNIEIENYTFGEENVQDSLAKVVVNMETKGLLGLSKEGKKEIVFFLARKDGKWKIKDIAGILESMKKRPVREEEEKEKEESNP